MISVCQLYNDFKGRENTWQGGHARPNSFASWLHEIQIEAQNDLIKALGNNQIVTDNLRCFIKSVQVPVGLLALNGLITYPKDYRRFSSLRFFSRKPNGPGVLCKDKEIMCGEKLVCVDDCEDLTEEQKADAENSEVLIERGIEMIQNNFWPGVIADEIVPPSIENPFATQFDKGFKVLPKGLGYAVLDYVSIPERPVFAYTRDAKQNIICNTTNCTDLVWGEEMIPEFLARLKKRYSAFIRNGEGYREGESEREITKS